MHDVIGFIAGMVQRKMRFLFIVLTLGVAGIVYAHGLSWLTAFVVLLAVVALGGFWVLTSFWIALFRNFGKSDQNSREAH